MVLLLADALRKLTPLLDSRSGLLRRQGLELRLLGDLDRLLGLRPDGPRVHVTRLCFDALEVGRRTLRPACNFGLERSPTVDSRRVAVERFDRLLVLPKIDPVLRAAIDARGRQVVLIALDDGELARLVSLELLLNVALAERARLGRRIERRSVAGVSAQSLAQLLGLLRARAPVHGAARNLGRLALDRAVAVGLAGPPLASELRDLVGSLALVAPARVLELLEHRRPELLVAFRRRLERVLRLLCAVTHNADRLARHAIAHQLSRALAPRALRDGLARVALEDRLEGAGRIPRLVPRQGLAHGLHERLAPGPDLLELAAALVLDALVPL